MKMTAVKSTFEYQGRTFKSYWNGKKYSDGTMYITATSDTGSEAKIVASPAKGLSVGGSHSIEFARAAYKSIVGEDW
jgi:hypothetical protein